jgi:hypothetical protein
MRKNATDYTRPAVTTMGSYHGRNFKNLVVFNSDRKINLDDDYTVSANNTESTKKLVKVGSHMKVFGIELETVGAPISLGQTVYTNLVELIFNKAGFDDDFFKIESDCTVNGECITQTFTKAWLRNNYKLFKGMYELFDTFQITTNDSRCGMHVNIDLANFGSDYDTQIENVRKLGYVINKHYNFFKVAFNRNGSTNWCPRMNYTMDYWKNTDLRDIPTSHDMCCVNVGHVRQSRLEIRLVGGQKNYACFRNTMETVFHLIERVCKLSWNDLDDLTKIFKGCNVHVYDRIRTNCLTANVITESDVRKIGESVKEERFL